MEASFSESIYPMNFRQKDARILGEHLRLRHSVELVGMKHVGISNFLNFFLYHKGIVKEYIHPEEGHMFIAVDLNDLVEREIFPLWALTFKRLVDKVEQFENFKESDERRISSMFLNSIQSRNIFLTIENLREAIKIIVENNINPTIFFIRFDRLKDTVNEEFLSNLEGLRDATAQKLAFVFTSFRSLDDLAPEIFSRKSLSVFSHLMYMKCAEPADMKIIFETFEKKYHVKPSKEQLEALIKICAGHVQYLQLSLIILNQKMAKDKHIPPEKLVNTITSDERINLISEEIWDSLLEKEQDVVQKIYLGEKLSAEDEERSDYLIEIGLVQNGDKFHLFSPLFAHFLKKHIASGGGYRADLTKKENSLFKLLLENIGEICERDTIIEKVWSEYSDLSVSDWTIDQLVARLRTKLKQQNSSYTIKTIRTRGYRMLEES